MPGYFDSCFPFIFWSIGTHKVNSHTGLDILNSASISFLSSFICLQCVYVRYSACRCCSMALFLCGKYLIVHMQCGLFLCVPCVWDRFFAWKYYSTAALYVAATTAGKISQKSAPCSFYIVYSMTR